METNDKRVEDLKEKLRIADEGVETARLRLRDMEFDRQNMLDSYVSQIIDVAVGDRILYVSAQNFIDYEQEGVVSSVLGRVRELSDDTIFFGEIHVRNIEDGKLQHRETYLTTIFAGQDNRIRKTGKKWEGQL